MSYGLLVKQNLPRPPYHFIRQFRQARAPIKAPMGPKSIFKYASTLLIMPIQTPNIKMLFYLLYSHLESSKWLNGFYSFKCLVLDGQSLKGNVAEYKPIPALTICPGNSLRNIFMAWKRIRAKQIENVTGTILHSFPVW